MRSLLYLSSGLKRAGWAFNVYEPSSRTLWSVQTLFPFSSRQYRKYISVLILDNIDNKVILNKCVIILALSRLCLLMIHCRQLFGNIYNKIVSNIMMFQSESKSVGSIEQEQECIFCTPTEESDAPTSLFMMMNQALYSKHTSNQSNNALTLPIDVLLKNEEPCNYEESLLCCRYKEFQFVDQDQQNLKRWYKLQEFDKKIQMLSEYYKFHKDIPRVIERSVQKILGKYHDRKREYDYKYLKRKLKEEQGLSITSIESSDTDNSHSVDKKSRYSTMLDALKNQSQVHLNQSHKLSDSNLLQEICLEIGKALPKVKVQDHQFNGQFFESEKKFENYIRKSQGRIKKPRIGKYNRFEWPSNAESFKKQKQGEGNYLDMKKKSRVGNDRTVKNKNDTRKFSEKQPSKNYDRSIRNERSNQEKSEKKFIYNTNVKIQIKNALFELKSPVEGFSTYDKNNKSRKSLVGKISNLNDDRYRTPVTKIYQPQIQETDNRYRKRSTVLKRDRERLPTKQSKDYRQKRHSSQSVRRVFSSNALNKRPDSKIVNNEFRPKFETGRTVSVSKLKLENPKAELRIRSNSHKSYEKIDRRYGATQGIGKRQVNSQHNTNARNSMQKIPIMKYSSSDLKDPSRSRGVSIKDLLTKKLNIHQRG